MVNCDLCNKEVYLADVYEFTNNEMKQIIKCGFNPFSIGIASIPPTQKDPKIFYENWKNYVLNVVDSNWLICQECNENLASYQNQQKENKNNNETEVEQ